MAEKDLIGLINKSCRPDSILVSGKDGLFRLFTPFRVKANVTIGEVKRDHYYLIYKVSTTKDWKLLLYVIRGKAYLHSYFELLD